MSRIAREHFQQWEAESDKRLRDTQSSLERGITSLAKNNRDLLDNVRRLTERNEDLLREKTKLDAENNSLNGRFRCVTEDNDSLRDEVKHLQDELKTFRDKTDELENANGQLRNRLQGAAAAQAMFADLHAKMGAALHVFSDKTSISQTSAPPLDNDDGASEHSPAVQLQTPKPTDASLPAAPGPPSRSPTHPTLPQRPSATKSAEKAHHPRTRVSVEVAPIASILRRSPSVSRRGSLEPGEIEPKRRPWFSGS